MSVLSLLLLAQDGGGALPGWSMWFPVVAIFLIMYFLVIAPQRKKEKKRQQMLKSLEKNDRVITIGGIHGVVKNMGEQDVTLLVDERRETAIKVSRSAVYSIVNRREKGELSPDDVGERLGDDRNDN